ncbi:hypothetical protein LSAT2_032993 [Lamellibrachia satsuma]|nr:hypothetical protein LSAT2_032993 [Lamellibrachia satsuma]
MNYRPFSQNTAFRRHYRGVTKRRDFAKISNFLSTISLQGSLMNNVPVAMSETDGNDLGGGDQSLTDAVQLSINAIEDDIGSTGEPSPKRLRTDDTELTVDQTQSIKQILFNINKAICLRLDAMENKLESVNLRTKYLEEKFDQLLLQLRPDGDSSFYKPGYVALVIS